MKDTKISNLSRFSFLVMGVITIIIAIATIIEKQYGTDFVTDNIYCSTWLILIWAVLGCVSLVLLILLWKHIEHSTRLLHIAFIVIMTGGLLTIICSEQGKMTLKHNIDEFQFVENETHLVKQIPFLLTIESQNENEVVLDIDMGTELFTISPNHPLKKGGYRMYLMSSDCKNHKAELFINHDSYGTALSYLGYLLLFTAVVMILFKQMKKVKHLRGWQLWSLFLVPLGALAYCMRWFLTDEPIPYVLRTGWLVVHVSIVISAYILFSILFVQGIIGLIKMKHRNEKVNESKFTILNTATLLLATGIFIGAMWANESWGTYWSWDPKESWALITMMAYAVPLHRMILPTFKNSKTFNIYIVAVYMTVLMTYLGVNYFLGGLHSYAN